MSNHDTSSPIPAFGLGTFRLKGQVVIDSVKTGLELGYRTIDTAQIYGNEAEVGQAIAESGVARSELFVTTKIWTDNYAKDKLVPSLEESLAKLRTDHVDLTLIHWPSPGNAVPVAEFMGALAEAKALGLELHPYLQNRKVAEFAQSQGIHITSYMTLAYGKVINDPAIEAIAKAHGATTAQVVLAWAMQLGYAVIPSSTKRANLESNLKAQQLRLSDAEMAQIAALDRGERLTDPAGLSPAWD